MTSMLTRGRLLTGSAFVVASAVGLAAPAQAQCVVTATTVTCATTDTTNTTNAGGTPASDREYLLDTTAGNATGTVSTGAAVTGNGLAFTASPVGANTLVVVNNGSVTVDAGETPTVGGTAALNINASGATAVDYSGAGDVTNLGTAGDGLEITSSGTGAVLANVGGSVTSAVGGDGISIVKDGSATSGDITLTTTAGETIRADFVGVRAQANGTGYTGNVNVTNNAAVGSLTGAPNTLDYGVAATSSGTAGTVTLTNTGQIGSATDQIQVFGLYAVSDNAAGSTSVTVNNGAGAIFADNGILAQSISTGAINVTTGTGAITAVDRGILVNAGGTNTTTIVTGTGAITASDAAGIGIEVAGGGTGPTSITTNGTVTGGNFGIQAATTGTQAFTVNGVTTGTTGAGIHSNTTANRTITVGTAGNVTGGAQAILLANTGTATVTNSGIIGAASTDVAIDATAAGATVVNNQTAGRINGSVLLGAGNDTVTNAGIINAGTLSFGAGTDLLTNQAGGTLTVAGATPITGLETLNNAGTITAATGLTFDDGNTALNNTGTINLTGALDFGAGTDSFANSGAGVLNLTGNASIVGAETFTNTGRTNLNNFTLTGSGAFNNTGTIDTSGNASLLGFTTFSNAGTLDLAAGTLTVPAAVFTNTGTILADEGATTITGQTSFANSGTIDLQDGATGDVLTINSPFVGSGASTLLVDFDAATADRLVINGAASGSTTVNANNLGAGLINLGGVVVVDGTTTATPGAFVLGTVGGNTSPLVDYSLVQNGADFLLVSTPEIAAFDPLAVTSFGRGLWYQSADEVIAQTRLPAATIGGSFWGHVYLSRDRMDDDSVQTLDGADFDIDRNLRTKRRGIQLGADYGFDGGRVGITAGYARAKADGRGTDELGLKANGWNVGVYGQFGGPVGFHGELLAKHDRYNVDFNNGAFDGEDTDARANGIDGAIGYRFPIGGDATVDANAGVSFVRTKFDDVNAFGFNYDLDTMKSTRGRAGLRATFGGSMSPYIDGTVYREFRGDGRVALFDGANTFDLESEGKATWFRAEAGILPNPTGLMLAAWADLGDKKGFGARLGFRFGGAPVLAAAPAPVLAPPPPPPAPPATQTCPDGSVILATDSCPLPPPPPPPPPPAPERG